MVETPAIVIIVPCLLRIGSKDFAAGGGTTIKPKHQPIKNISPKKILIFLSNKNKKIASNKNINAWETNFFFAKSIVKI